MIDRLLLPVKATAIIGLLTFLLCTYIYMPVAARGRPKIRFARTFWQSEVNKFLADFGYIHSAANCSAELSSNMMYWILIFAFWITKNKHLGFSKSWNKHETVFIFWFFQKACCSESNFMLVVKLTFSCISTYMYFHIILKI